MKGLTQERLKEVLNYSPDTGIFIWKKLDTNTTKVGDIAGAKHTQGYTVIQIDGKVHKAHRLAFLYMEGVVPIYVDHVNTVTDDNRFINLRKATNMENSWNRPCYCTNIIGIKGISYDSRPAQEGYQARLQARGKKYAKWFSVSRYGTKELALKAAIGYVKTLREEEHGEFANHG